MAIPKRYTEQIVVLCKPETRERLTRLADDQERSVSAVIREALEIGLQAIEHEEAGGKKRARAA